MQGYAEQEHNAAAKLRKVKSLVYGVLYTFTYRYMALQAVQVVVQPSAAHQVHHLPLLLASHARKDRHIGHDSLQD